MEIFRVLVVYITASSLFNILHVIKIEKLLDIYYKSSLKTWFAIKYASSYTVSLFLPYLITLLSLLHVH